MKHSPGYSPDEETPQRLSEAQAIEVWDDRRICKMIASDSSIGWMNVGMYLDMFDSGRISLDNLWNSLDSTGFLSIAEYIADWDQRYDDGKTRRLELRDDGVSLIVRQMDLLSAHGNESIKRRDLNWLRNILINIEDIFQESRRLAEEIFPNV